MSLIWQEFGGNNIWFYKNGVLVKHIQTTLDDFY